MTSWDLLPYHTTPRVLGPLFDGLAGPHSAANEDRAGLREVGVGFCQLLDALAADPHKRSDFGHSEQLFGHVPKGSCLHGNSSGPCCHDDNPNWRYGPTAKLMEDWFLADDLTTMGAGGIAYGIRRAETHEEVELFRADALEYLQRRGPEYCQAFPEDPVEEILHRIIDRLWRV